MSETSYMSGNVAEIDSNKFRKTLSHYASGVTIVSGMVDGEPTGFTCQSFHSLSMEPPLISFSVMNSSTTWPKLRTVRRFAVNVLAEDQYEISSVFGRSNIDRWAAVSWQTSIQGNPIIDGVLVWIDCMLHAQHDAGDHSIVIGSVQALGHPAGVDDRSPLLFYKGKYHHLAL
jgi:3-hydroxy-9,10-secoandrosta-1,3,5(10)-triene-9,17-dione monooxygenase reductase component